MFRKKQYAYRIMSPIPYLELGGGLAKNFFNSPQYQAIDTSNVNIPKGTTGVTQQKTSGSGMGIASGVGAAAGSIFSALASSNRGTIAPDSSTQQTFDALASNIPFYSVGNALGDWAATDYKNIQSDPNNADFGKLTDPGKYDVASTISGFLGPDNLISGLSGEGWTAKQRREKIEAQTAPQRKQIAEQQATQLKQREIGAGLGGRYFDQNQLMQAEMGGPLNVGYYTDAVLGSSMQLGGPISKNYGMTRADLPQLSNYNAGTDIYEEGGALGQQPMQPRGSMITSYDGDMSHAESPIQGTPVDEHGNRVVTSNTRPVAKVQGGEISYFSKKAGKSYVFSNDLFID